MSLAEYDSLDPLEWAYIAMTCDSLEAAHRDLWQRVSQVIEIEGSSMLVGGAPLPGGFRSGAGIAIPEAPYASGYIISHDWVDFINCGNNWAKDPTAKRFTRDASPLITWEGCEFFEQLSGTEKKFINNYYDHGFHAGVVIPNIDFSTGTIDAFLFHSNAPIREFARFGQEFKRSLKLAHVYFCEGMRVREIAEHAPRPLLSDREKECLLWTAAGETTSDISERLKLSDATVNEYLCKARRKLGATTRIQACARATLLGCIMQ